MGTMRKLSIWLLGAGAFGLVGCGSSNPPARVGQITLTWTLKDNANPNGPDLGCVPGETVSLTAGGASDIFPCTAFGGTTAGFPPGNYAVSVSLRDQSGAVESMTPTPLPATVLAGQITDIGHIIFLVNVAPSTGDVSLSWEIRVGSTGGPMGQCASGEIAQFTFDSSMVLAFDCLPLAALIRDVPAGTHTVDAALYLGSTLESQTVAPFTVDVPAGGTSAQHHVVFVVRQ